MDVYPHESYAIPMLVDELIRQVTINCAERGLLLLRVRDEIRMTIAAYQTLYESSVAFGMRKALQAEQGKADMERKVSVENTNLDKRVNEVSVFVVFVVSVSVSVEMASSLFHLYSR